ncbi:hypothetical protein Tco_0908794 [Tanacetum coccineum]|uniref:Uncharacterized protein n=1 Tax=Tanacetum coccineum TaxID=301880 RepID=A0ABQ5CP83_9ASTR
MLWEWRGIANMAFIQLGGGVSRVDEMILARVSSGFAGEKYGATYKLYLGLLGGKEGFMGSGYVFTIGGGSGLYLGSLPSKLTERRRLLLVGHDDCRLGLRPRFFLSHSYTNPLSSVVQALESRDVCTKKRSPYTNTVADPGKKDPRARVNGNEEHPPNGDIIYDYPPAYDEYEDEEWWSCSPMAKPSVGCPAGIVKMERKGDEA